MCFLHHCYALLLCMINVYFRVQLDYDIFVGIKVSRLKVFILRLFFQEYISIANEYLTSYSIMRFPLNSYVEKQRREFHCTYIAFSACRPRFAPIEGPPFSPKTSWVTIISLWSVNLERHVVVLHLPRTDNTFYRTIFPILCLNASL